MADTILIQQVYPRRGYVSLLAEVFRRHAEYCERWDMDYQAMVYERLPAENGNWDKVPILRRALDLYNLVVFFDADTYIHNKDVDLRSVPNPPDTIGVVTLEAMRFYPTHYNVGALYIRNGERVQKFMADWMTGYPCPKHNWHEQKVFNDIANDVVYRLPDTWNYTIGRHKRIANPFLKAFHPVRGAEAKLEAMREEMKREG